MPNRLQCRMARYCKANDRLLCSSSAGSQSRRSHTGFQIHRILELGSLLRMSEALARIHCHKQLLTRSYLGCMANQTSLSVLASLRDSLFPIALCHWPSRGIRFEDLVQDFARRPETWSKRVHSTSHWSCWCNPHVMLLAKNPYQISSSSGPTLRLTVSYWPF